MEIILKGAAARSNAERVEVYSAGRPWPSIAPVRYSSLQRSAGAGRPLKTQNSPFTSLERRDAKDAGQCPSRSPSRPGS